MNVYDPDEVINQSKLSAKSKKWFAHEVDNGDADMFIPNETGVIYLRTAIDKVTELEAEIKRLKRIKLI